MTSGEPAGEGRAGGARELLVPLALALVLGVVAFRAGPRTCDDAYITFRYARNLVSGHGFVYNVGERVLGTSAPLWGALLAGLSALTGSRDFPWIALVVSAVCLPLTTLLGWKLLRRAVPPVLAAALLASALSSPHALWVLATGMETPLYLLGLVACWWLLSVDRPTSAFAVASLLPFVHPDAAVVFAAAAIAIRMREGAWPVGAALRGALPGALAAAALTVYFGSPVPLSLTAKALLNRPPAGEAAGGFADALQGALVPVPDPLPPVPGWDLAVGVAPTLLLFALALATVLASRHQAVGTPFAAASVAGVALFTAYAVGNPMLFEWYDPPFVLAAVIGVAPFLARGWLAIPWAALLLGAAVVHVEATRPYDPTGREEVYRRAVESLRLSSSDRVAAVEIGAVGYFTEARVLDTVGLVSPETISFRRARGGKQLQNSAVPPGFLKEFEPPFLIAMDAYLEPSLATDPRLLDGYRETASIPGIGWNSRSVRIYQRVER